MITNPYGLDPDVIAFAGDWHGNTTWMKEALDTVAASDVKVILHTGDFGFKFAKNYMSGLRHKLAEHDQHLFFVDGNHDNHPDLFSWFRDDFGFGVPRYGSDPNRIHYIPRGHRWSWWDKIFLGVGGAVSVDRNGRTPYSTWWPEEVISAGDVYRASEGGRAHIMLTHDIPESATLPNLRKSSGWPEDALRDSKQNREMLQSVVEAVEPELLVHGHFHVYHEQQVGGMQVISLDRDTTGMHKNLYIVGPDLKRRPHTYAFAKVSDKLAAARAAVKAEADLLKE